MLAAILRFSLSQRLFMLLISALLIGLGTRAWVQLPIDAFPDISPTQVKIIVKAPGMTPTEIESQITRLIEFELLGIPSQTMLRSTTKYAITAITLDFEESTDIYWARQQVSERLANIWQSLPAGISGGMAPMSTPLSEMFMFTVENDALTLKEKRELLDWQIRPALRGVSGVAEVNSLGGYVKTYEVTPDLTRMQALNIQWSDIHQAITQTNLNTGLGKIEQGNDLLVVRVEGKFRDIDDIADVTVAHRNGQVVYLSDIANVTVGHLTRYGGVTRNAEEAVQGLVIALKGANAASVVTDVKAKLKAITPSLPEGTQVNVFYDRSRLIETATGTITSALVQAILLVIILLLLFLGDIRAAIVVSCSLPLAALSTFLVMKWFGFTANLMSLGGLVIAIGMLVDSSVVIIENTVNQLSRRNGLPKLHNVFRAAHTVALPIVSGTLIIIIVFSPLLTLTGLEGKLFSPVAFTIVFAMISSLILSLTVIPVLGSLVLKENVRVPHYILWVQQRYRQSLNWAMHHVAVLIIISGCTLVGGVWLFLGVGKSFMPTLDEGDIIVQLEKSPTISLDASLALDRQIEQALLNSVPEIVQVVSRTGSDELGLDPMGLNESDLFMELKPADEWRFESKDGLEAAIRDVINRFPGININFTQPIQMRVSEMLTGSSGDVSIKIFGDEVTVLAELAEKVASQTMQTAGATDVKTALIEGGRILNIRPYAAVARSLGVTSESLAAELKAQLEGSQISQVIENNKFTPVLFNNTQSGAGQPTMKSVADMRGKLIMLPDGTAVPLSTVAEIREAHVPLLIEREQAKRFATISTNVDGRDIVGFVEELQTRLDSNISLPQGYSFTYGGEFENQQKATASLLVLVPVALLLIFIILFSTFRSLPLAALILANIPFALMGGVYGLYISGEYLSVPASIGFIALLGVAVLNGVVMIEYFEQRKLMVKSLSARVLDGAQERVRPILMTATTALFGLMPLVYAVGPGAEIQKPLAIVVIGGLMTSTLTTLYLLPVGYHKMEKRREAA
ncbi:MAG: CusA/CzcA family heavy metal efflux RND transporter [Idiomarinaceae bacterium]|nr:CusA/CzcA family heavy metal efflux RND transporter [Idiomarinaceae bacterium]